MNERTDLSLSNSDPDAGWQANLLALARELPYPATPDLRAAVKARLTAPGRAPIRLLGRPIRPAYLYVAAIILVALLALLAVPSVRAGLLDFLQIGAVRVILPTSTPVVTSTPAALTATPSPTPILSVLDLAGETTLADARQRAAFTLRLPAYPPGLGPPDAVFVQDLDGQTIILVWLDPSDRTRVRLSLQFIASTVDFEKTISTAKQNPAGLEFTNVNGEAAFWTTGPYILETRAGAYLQRRLIQGHVLIWSDGNLTYRLETDQSVAEAVRTAESLGQ